jgi:hypothetical protein
MRYYKPRLEMTEKQKEVFDTLTARLDQSKDGPAWRKDRALIRQVQKTAKRMEQNARK